MEQQPRTLTLDNVQARSTLGAVRLSGWMEVSDALPRQTEQVLQKLQQGTSEPWLAPRHQWMLRDGRIYAHFDNVAPFDLWNEYEEAAALAAKGIAALERIMEIVTAVNPSASYQFLAESAERIRNAGLPVIIERKE